MEIFQCYIPKSEPEGLRKTVDAMEEQKGKEPAAIWYRQKPNPQSEMRRMTPLTVPVTHGKRVGDSWAMLY
jgi:hypothetical protein